MLDYSGWRSYNNLNFFKCDGKRKKNNLFYVHTAQKKRA